MIGSVMAQTKAITPFLLSVNTCITALTVINVRKIPISAEQSVAIKSDKPVKLPFYDQL